MPLSASFQSFLKSKVYNQYDHEEEDDDETVADEIVDVWLWFGWIENIWNFSDVSST